MILDVRPIFARFLLYINSWMLTVCPASAAARSRSHSCRVWRSKTTAIRWLVQVRSVSNLKAKHHMLTNTPTSKQRHICRATRVTVRIHNLRNAAPPIIQEPINNNSSFLDGLNN